MTPNDLHHDPVLAALSELPACDVDQRRADRLGVRCRIVLTTHTRAAPAPVLAASARWTRATGLVLLVAWCAIYVVEIVRRGSVVWGL